MVPSPTETEYDINNSTKEGMDHYLDKTNNKQKGITQASLGKKINLELLIH